MLEYITTTFGIPLVYFLFVCAAASAIFFPAIQMFQNLKKARTALIGIGIIVILFSICYLLADRQEFTIGDITVAANQMKFIEASIYLVYILFTGTVLSMIFSSFSRYFK